jgi:hypothetical protein
MNFYINVIKKECPTTYEIYKNKPANQKNIEAIKVWANFYIKYPKPKEIL